MIFSLTHEGITYTKRSSGKRIFTHATLTWRPKFIQDRSYEFGGYFSATEGHYEPSFHIDEKRAKRIVKFENSEEQKDFNMNKAKCCVPASNIKDTVLYAVTITEEN